MGKQIKELRELCYIKVLDLRSLMYLLNTKKFEEAYTNATDKEKEKAIHCIKDMDRVSLHSWVKNQSKDEFKTVKELRLIAKNLSIVNYNSLKKVELVHQIEGLKNDIQPIKKNSK